MGDATSAFFGVFSVLGLRLLFFSTKPVTLGSVVLLASVSGALAQTIAGSAALTAGATRLFLFVNETCAAGALPPDASSREVVATAVSYVWLRLGR